MQPNPESKTKNNIFLRHMRTARLRLTTMAIASVTVAAIAVASFSADSIGPFAFYSIISLLLINAIAALLQFQRVIRPVTTLLKSLQSISDDIDAGNNTGLERLAYEADDAFSCLAAGFDDLLAKLFERIRSLETEGRQREDVLSAVPLALSIVSKTGKVFRLVKNQDESALPEGFESGQTPSAEIWGEKNLAAFKEGINKAFSSGTTVWLDFPLKTPDRGERHFRTSIKRINDFSALMALADMTDIENTLDEKAEAIISQAKIHKRTALRHMAATLAHDAKNIFSVLQNLVDTAKTSKDETVLQTLPIADDAIRHGTLLMKELSTFAGEFQLHRKSQPAAKSLLNIINDSTIRALIPQNVKVIVPEVDPNLPEIDIDSDQLWKVVCNLVKNAVEAMNGNNGRVWFRIEPYTMNAERAKKLRHSSSLADGKGVMLSIMDDGPGIPESLAAHIFDPYSSSKGEGRGLGLATVMTIIDAHNGAIGLESSMGLGTTFNIFLPASRATAAELEMIQEVAPNGEILLVDDDPMILHTTSLVMRALKIAAHPAANEADALAKLRSLHDRIRAALIDANINGLTSVNLVRTIQSEFPNLPIIIVSGAPKETIDEQFAGVNGFQFLAKPYAITELQQILADIPKK